jgi:hypothetical protein
MTIVAHPEEGLDPSLRSGFRQRASAALTPAKRLNFNRSRASPRPDKSQWPVVSDQLPVKPDSSLRSE